MLRKTHCLLQKVLSTSLISCSFLLAMSSCGIETITSANYDSLKVQDPTGEFAFPLGKTSFTIEEFLKDQKIDGLEVGDDKLIKFVINKETEFDASDKFVALEDLTRPLEVKAPATPASPLSIPNVSLSKSFEINYTNNTQKEVIDSVEYDGGEFEVKITSDLPNDVVFKIKIPNFKKTEGNETKAMTISDTVSKNLSKTKSVNLDGYKTVFSNNASGAIETKFKIDLEANTSLGSGQSLTGNEKLKLEVSLKGQSFSVVYGKFGQDTKEISEQTIDLDFLKDFGKGITFEDPKIKFDIDNSFRVPVKLDFSNFVGINTKNNTETKLSGDIIDNKPSINFPLNAGETANTSFTISKDNSNIDKLLASSPDQIKLALNILTNPDGITDTTKNFITRTGKMKSKVSIEVPMILKFTNVSQSTEFDTGGALDNSFFDNVESIALKIISDNEFPFSGKAQFDVVNELGEVKYTSEKKEILKAPEVDSEGKATSPGKNTVEIAIEDGGLQALKVAGTKIKLNLKLNTPDSDFVRIISTAKLDLKVGFSAKFKDNNSK